MAAVNDLVVATGTIRYGRLHLHNRRAFDVELAQLRDGWSVEVTISRLRATRSQLANNFYWGVVVQALSLYTGYSPNEMHEILKMRFLPKRLAICNGNGEIVDEYVVGGSTRDLTIEEFAAYLWEIQQWAAELDLVIPDPDQPMPVTQTRIDDASRPVWYRAKPRRLMEAPVDG